MYNSFEEAKKAAINVINKNNAGAKMGCCVSETKMSKCSKKTFFGFRFYSEDTNGRFIMNYDGTYSRLTVI